MFARSGALLLPEAQRADRGLVVEREQARRLAGAAVVVLDPVPRRGHERIARLPRELGLADTATAAALDHVEDAARRRAARPPSLPSPQPVRVGPPGRHPPRARARRVAARDRPSFRRAT